MATLFWGHDIVLVYQSQHKLAVQDLHMITPHRTTKQQTYMAAHAH